MTKKSLKELQEKYVFTSKEDLTLVMLDTSIKKYYLNFNYRNYEFDTFIFNDELFAGMEVDKAYTLEELGL